MLSRKFQTFEVGGLGVDEGCLCRGVVLYSKELCFIREVDLPHWFKAKLTKNGNSKHEHQLGQKGVHQTPCLDLYP